MARLAGLVLLAFALATPAGAQVITPLAGEHADFTRVVLRLPPGAGWTFTPEGRERRFTVIPGGARFDLAGLFVRIPRTRLAAAGADGGTLTLSLGCDCPVRAWEDRPGLVILDISDAPLTAPDLPGMPRQPAPAPAPRRAPDPFTTARSAGEALARRLPRPDAEDPAPPGDDPRLAALAEDLGRTIASALGQGLLDPAVDHVGRDPGLLADTPLPDLPANMRVETVLTRRDPAAMPPPDPPVHCAGAEVLDRILNQDVANFASEAGRLSRALYGEFDQPDAQVRLDLIGLYLAAGFGAEARALLDNGPDPVAGRDFVRGMADVLEDRASNSRMRLAQAIDCGGAVSLMAVPAGADAAGIARNADQLALGFSALPPALRGMIGLRLAAAMAEAGALDEARIVADSLERSDWVSAPELALVQARLDRARGLPGDAAARLAAEGDSAVETVQTRLDLAIETQGNLDAAYIAGAEALAATTRDTATGPELMAAVIRLHTRSGALPDAFAALDRLESWMSATGENRRLQGLLRDEVWAALAANGTDFGLVEAVLARTDWQDPALETGTRLALAQRLLDLGLTGPVAGLIDGLAGPEARVLQARRALAEGDAETARALLDGLEDDEARRTRAAALGRLGDHGGAGAEFTALGITDAAARAAILAGDWRRVEAMADDRTVPAPAAGLGPMLGRTPGHAEVARSQAAGAQTAGSPPAGEAVDIPRDPAADAPQDSMLPGGAGLEVPSPAAPLAGNAVPPAGEAAALAPPAPAPAAAPAAAVAGVVFPAAVPRAEDGPEAAAPLPGTAPPDAAPAAGTRPGASDPGAAFDRLGLVSRSSTLLSESERLRDALAPLLVPSLPPTN